MKFELVAYINPRVEGEEPNDRLGIKNHLAHPQASLSFTTTTGLIIPLDWTAGASQFVATKLVLNDEGVLVPTRVHLPDVLNRGVVDEIRDFLINIYHCAFVVTYTEGVQFEIHDAAGVDEYSEVGKDAGGEFQRSFRAVYSQGVGNFQWIKFDLMEKGNRSFASLRSGVLGALVSAVEACGLQEQQPFGANDTTNIVDNMKQDVEESLQEGTDV